MQALVDSRMDLLSDENYGMWRSRSNVKACLTGEAFQVLRNVNRNPDNIFFDPQSGHSLWFNASRASATVISSS